VAATLLVVGLVHAIRRERRLDPVAAVSALAAFALSCYPIVLLLPGSGGCGVALLGLAAFYGAIGAALLCRLRDLSTQFSGLALALAATAGALLVEGSWTVVAGAAGAVVLDWLAGRAREPPLLAGAVEYLALALGHALTLEASPQDLIVARAASSSGAPAILVGALAVGAVAYLVRDRRAWWLAGVLAVLRLSLAILGLAEAVFDAGVRADLQRGHTAVSAFCGSSGPGSCMPA
jgi:hypothetical protein